MRNMLGLKAYVGFEFVIQKPLCISIKVLYILYDLQYICVNIIYVCIMFTIRACGTEHNPLTWGYPYFVNEFYKDKDEVVF